MYINKLSVTNIKLLADQEFSFLKSNGRTRFWTVFIGDNGVCKTTILQAIALATSGDKLARALVRDASEFRCATSPEKTAKIMAVLKAPLVSGRNTAIIRSNLHVKPGNYAFDGEGPDASVLNDLRSTREKGYLSVGYGVGRMLARPGEVAIPKDPIQDRVESLFNTRHKMLGISFFEALKNRDERVAQRFSQALYKTLMARDDNGEYLLPSLVTSRIEQRGAGGGSDHLRQLLENRRMEVDVHGQIVEVAPTALSHGYQSMLAWMADLLGHACLEFGAEMHPKNLKGIVLLDEIGLHLHPTWQRRIVPILKSAFPLLQFIVTTHSPLVLSGFEQDEIIGLHMEKGRVVQRQAPFEPGVQSASGVLSSFFGVFKAGRPELVNMEREYVELKVRSDLSAEEALRLEELESKLSRYWVARGELPSPEELAEAPE